MQVLDVIQRSPEWLKARRANITSSRIDAVVNFRKDGKEGADRRKMKLEIIQELVKNRCVEHYVTPAMERGIELEPRARAEYEYRYGVEIDPIGYVVHNTIERCGASPDGWIQPDGFIEIKVPLPATHLEYLISGEVPKEYVHQMQWQMCCAGEEITHCQFVSFDPDLPEELQLFVRRVDRDEKKIAFLEEQAIIFLDEVVKDFEKARTNARLPSLEDKLRESVKQSRGKYTDEQLHEMLKDEGIVVP